MQTKEKSPKRARGTRLSRNPLIVHIYPALGRSINVTMIARSVIPFGETLLLSVTVINVFEIQTMPPFEDRFETQNLLAVTRDEITSSPVLVLPKLPTAAEMQSLCRQMRELRFVSLSLSSNHP